MTMGKVTRRAFVGAVACVAAGAAVGCVGRAFNGSSDILRPPLADASGDFESLCIKCERCTSVCPQGIIKPAGIEEGPIQARTPQIDFKKGYCTFCNLCVQVCPTGALVAANPQMPSSGRIGAAIIHEDACLAFKESGSCGVCIDACVYGALSFDDERRPVVDNAKCNGCGRCVAVCPADVATRFDGADYRGVEVITSDAAGKEGESA